MLKPVFKLKEIPNRPVKAALRQYVRDASSEPTAQAGFPESTAGGVMLDDTPVIDVARFVEFGTRKMRERPFMRAAFESNKSKYRKMIRKAVVQALHGKKLMAFLDGLGREMSNDIKQFERSLVRSKRMHKSISYEVIKGRPKGVLNV